MYHREGEGDDGIIVGARKAAGPDTCTVISQITGVGGSQSSKDGEGKDVFHFEDSWAVWCEALCKETRTVMRKS